MWTFLVTDEGLFAPKMRAIPRPAAPKAPPSARVRPETAAKIRVGGDVNLNSRAGPPPGEGVVRQLRNRRANPPPPPGKGEDGGSENACPRLLVTIPHLCIATQPTKKLFNPDVHG